MMGKKLTGTGVAASSSLGGSTCAGTFTASWRSIYGVHEVREEGETPMNWDTVKGDWKQFSGKVKAQWGKLTDDELAEINGNREQLEGKLQSHYGYAKDKAKAEIDNWCSRM